MIGMSTVLFFTTTLGISTIGLTLLVGIKHWEVTRGRMLARGLRARTHTFFHHIVLWVEHIIPTVARLYSRWAWRRSLSVLHRVSAHAVLRVEHTLERVLHGLRHSTDVKRGMGEASAFLREVAEHKKKLLRTEPARVRMHKELLHK
jgi:hypothetical protein